VSKSPRDWLNKRLRAEEIAPGGPVRLRLDGCRPKEALALLNALVEAYDNNHRADRAYEVEIRRAKQQRVWAVLVAQGGGNALILTDILMESRQDAPAVIRRPRLVGPAR
jgi:hypothetical protein